MTLCKDAAGIKNIFNLFLFSVSYPTKLQFKIYSFCNRKSSVMRAYTSPFINEGSNTISFYIDNDSAKKISLTGSFNDWAQNSILLKHDTNGLWRVDIPM